MFNLSQVLQRFNMSLLTNQWSLDQNNNNSLIPSSSQTEGTWTHDCGEKHTAEGASNKSLLLDWEKHTMKGAPNKSLLGDTVSQAQVGGQEGEDQVGGLAGVDVAGAESPVTGVGSFTKDSCFLHLSGTCVLRVSQRLL